MTQKKNNHYLSVDCVVLGFDGKTMKVVLIEQKGKNRLLTSYKTTNNNTWKRRWV